MFCTNALQLPCLKVCLDVQIRSPFLSPYNILHSCWVVGGGAGSPGGNPSQIKYGQHRPSDSRVNPSYSSLSSFGSAEVSTGDAKELVKTVQCSFFFFCPVCLKVAETLPCLGSFGCRRLGEGEVGFLSVLVALVVVAVGVVAVGVFVRLLQLLPSLFLGQLDL